LQECGNVPGGDRQIFQDLQHRDRFGNFKIKGLVGETIGYAFHAFDDVAVAALNIPAQRVVEGDGIGQGAQRGIGEAILVVNPFDQDLLQHLDGGAQSQPAGFACQSPEELE